ncbi:hypothetical protein TRFO_04228 [Tritrichomonas foetus]|uniref:Uncharacterized protein n=1 Tax=Tritrichomonas foetus TaxID=1144522 RepID=A0A1J4KI28_9EUKA|nr:hypothetical protein TRFO_04228 [Tritrichomonas foetus]|eukprot:OHT10698.1 hypothetical protein TRFO_04228 [Tritrichomonas foetus]
MDEKSIKIIQIASFSKLLINHSIVHKVLTNKFTKFIIPKEAMENITIILHIPNGAPLAITVNSHDTASALEPYVDGDGTHSFYYKNIPICPAFTFKWFGIGDGTHIYVDEMDPNALQYSIPNNKKSNTRKCSIKQSKSKSTSKHSMKPGRSQEAPTRPPSMLNNVNAENARIKDQFFRKVEGTVVCYRKIMKRFTHMSANEQDCGNRPSPTIISESPDHPSTDSLPIFWNDSDMTAMNYSTISSPITTEL